MVGATVCALIDWHAVAYDRPGTEALVKPAVMVLLALAVAVGGDAWVRWIVVGALLTSLVGDVLLLERFDRFIGGLSAFLVSHALYLAAFVVQAFRSPVAVTAVAGTAVAAIGLLMVGRIIARSAARSNDRLSIPVAIYIAMLSSMLIAAWATGSIAAIFGATLFAASDAVLGWNRFVTPIRLGRFQTHVLYHAGQGLLAVWAILL